MSIKKYATKKVVKAISNVSKRSPKSGVESALEKAKVAPTNLGTITRSRAASATNRVESAGAVRNIPKTTAKDYAVLGGTAVAVGAGIAYNMSKKGDTTSKPAVKTPTYPYHQLKAVPDNWKTNPPSST